MSNLGDVLRQVVCIPSNIPDDWSFQKLTNVCSPKQWRTVSSSEMTKTGYPVFGANGFVGFYPEYNHADETIAITCRGNTCGTINRIPPKTYITGNSMALDNVQCDVISQNYLYYALKYRGVGDSISGSAQPQITGAGLRTIEFPAPPLPEQQKIAAILSSVDDVIEKTRAQIDKLKDLKTGMMQELLTKGIGSGGVPHTEFKDSPLGQMPKSWKLVDLGSIAKFSQGIQVGIELHYEVNTENRVRFLRISDFTKDDEKPRYIDSKLATKGVVKKDDIVMVRYGEAGRVCRGLSGAIANNLFKIKPEEQLDKDFLHLYLSMPTIFQMISMMAASSAMPAINFSSLSKLKIVLPDINEQREIALAIKKIELKLSVTKNKLAGYELLKKALMQDLLTGKVRVKIDQKESAVA